MNTSETPADTYAATLQLPHNKGFKGQLRNIYTGAVAQCEHTHRSRSAALTCAARLTRNGLATQVEPGI